MTLRVVPEGLAATGVAVEALAARLVAVQAAAAPSITAVIPPASDPVSLQAATSCSVQGSGHAVAAAEAMTELARAGMGVAQSGTNYAIGDAHAAVGYGGQGTH